MINKFDESQSFFYENGFYLTSQPYRMGNILAHYEVYKQITGIPGAVFEIGVFRGGLMQWGTFRELLENKNSRRIVGFDMFGQFPSSNTVGSDAKFVEKWNRQFAGEFVSKEEIEESLRLKGFDNVQLVKDDIRDTLPRFLSENPSLRIALLHIDTDVYEPAKIALDACWNRVVRGGIVLLDDYATIEGETLAVDEFFKEKPYTIHKFPFSHEKPSWIIKE